MQIPQIGFGTFLASDPTKLKNALKIAIEECGVRSIDCAWIYGNQNVIGETFKEIFANGKVQRKDLFITSKLWCTSHRKDLVEPELRDTLKQLKLDYLDLFLIHQPVALKSGSKNPWPSNKHGKLALEQIDILETWKGMEDAQKKGLTRHIGVSNFSLEMLERIK